MTEKNIVIRVLKNAPQVARIRDNGVVRTWLQGQRGLDRELVASSERARGSEEDSSLAGQCTPTKRATKWLLFSMAPSKKECHTGASREGREKSPVPREGHMSLGSRTET